MKNRGWKRILALIPALAMLFSVSCAYDITARVAEDGQVETSGTESKEERARKKSGQEEAQTKSEENEDREEKGKGTAEKPDFEGMTFAEAHDAFQTTLEREESDDDPIPEPPEGLFDLVYYPSKVGELAAYVSSDPGDDEKHPLIIWVVGGWGNGIDDFPWIYPEWDDDQTGSAFWRSGVLTMYPSFRGGNGNPGYYETLFGEVDDIVSAYEYAASLPYVDPNRIYLGGHSTGATRALLATEYTDKFRAVFCFGAVDEIKYHNNSQFTFDTNIEDEYTMRSPIHWLEDIKTPTFLIEGRDGNSENLINIDSQTTNENINCYVIEDADHFSVLAPLTRVAAQKILEDTGDTVNISITQEELDEAMEQEPESLLPVMEAYVVDGIGLNFDCPYLWSIEDISEEGEFAYEMTSIYEDDNAWDNAVVYLDAWTSDNEEYFGLMAESLEEGGYKTRETTINGLPALMAVNYVQNDEGSSYKNSYVMIQNENIFVAFDFYVHERFEEEGDVLFEAIANSIYFEVSE
ncbi:MAG: prolyl oligopeptidase family serine peptidase [Roseburia sp.]|nr:prolyl oligopeptidase family serine peptidase [Roseburia sp.]